MKSFRILFVDDDRKYRERIDDEFGRCDDIELIIAATSAEAVEHLKASFFHIALVDLHLQNGEDANPSGGRLLERVRTLRPSCERILMTERVETSQTPIALLFHPIHGQAQGLIDKHNLLNSFRTFIDQRRREWLTHPIEIHGCETAAKAIEERLAAKQGSSETSVTPAEVDFLVSRLFGQERSISQATEEISKTHRDDDGRIASVHLDILKQGYSDSVVVKARSKTLRGAPGIWCVLKCASRDYISHEVQSYEQYVKYRLSVHNRVELLGWQLGDRLGVLCYNFASGNPDSVTSAGELFIMNSPLFETAISRLFAPDHKTWYGDVGPGIRLSEYFINRFKIDLYGVFKRIRTTICDMSIGDVPFRNDSNKCAFAGDTLLALPDKVITLGVFDVPLHSVVVHGDMHCDNIVVGSGGRPMLIDFFSVGYGPRLIDFAALECSIRLLTAQQPQRSPVNVQSIIYDESATWKHNWESNTAGLPLHPWCKASSLIAALAKSNFPDVTPDEYAATCLMWAIRMLKIPAIEGELLTRTILWATSLATWLDQYTNCSIPQHNK